MNTVSIQHFFYFFLFLLFVNHHGISQNNTELKLEGITTPSMSIELGSKLNGIIKQMNVKRSERIEKGMVLAVMDTRFEQSQAELAKAKVQLLETQIQLRSARLTFSHNQFKRKLDLFNKDTVSLYEKDEAETNYLVTQKSLDEAIEQKRVAELEWEHSKLMMDMLNIRSPINGVVEKLHVNIGELVNDLPIMKVIQLDPLFVEVIAPTSLWGNIHEGDTATVIPEIQVQDDVTAVVTVTDKVIDARSGTFGIRLEIKNTKNLLPAGMKCSVHFAATTN